MDCSAAAERFFRPSSMTSSNAWSRLLRARSASWNARLDFSCVSTEHN